MDRRIFFSVFLLGLLIWIVPFVVSMFFFDRTGRVAIDNGLFKSIMSVVLAVTSGYATVRLFRSKTPSALRVGLIAGAVWLIINWVLDLLILLPLSGMTTTEYWYAIGVRYLQIPVMAVAASLIRKEI